MIEAISNATIVMKVEDIVIIIMNTFNRLIKECKLKLC